MMLLGVGLRGNTKRRFAMTSTVLHQALTTVVALTLAATCAGAPAFAKDGKGNLHILVPKSDRGGSKVVSNQFIAPKSLVAPKAPRDNGGNGGGQVFTSQFVAPKANRDNGGNGGGQVFTSQFVAPKANRDNGGNGSFPVVQRVTPQAPVAEFVAPKAPRNNSNDSGITTAKFVAPKAPRGDQTVVASLEQPQPLLLAPATSTPAVVADQGSPVPAEASTDEASTPVAESQTAPVAADTAADTDSQVAVAHLRAAQHYGYGDYAPASYQASDEGYDESDSDNSYEDSDSSYSNQGYGDDNCN
jgi:hypothetical protein